MCFFGRIAICENWKKRELSEIITDGKNIRTSHKKRTLPDLYPMSLFWGMFVRYKEEEE